MSDQFLSTSTGRVIAFLIVLVLWPVSQGSGQVWINEVCTSNSSLIADPQYGKYSDWIELYNPGGTAVDIGGLFISDDTADVYKWQIPSGTSLEAGGYLLIFADGRDEGLHTNFNLGKRGEFISLINAQSGFVDSLTVPYLLNNHSFGRLASAPSTYSVFAAPTPSMQNSGNQSLRIAPFAEFTLPGGFFSGPQILALSSPYPEAKIYYTTDGSYPTESSILYSDTIHISRTSVIRAICYETGTIEGIAVTQTYFIDEPRNLPAFSLVTDSVHLFSDETGIMVKGTNGVDGYCTNLPYNLNRDWERPVNIEFYEMDGTQALNQICGAKIFGGCSRIRYPQKSLTFLARSEYETSSFSYQLFPDKKSVEYESFILRASGDDQPFTIFREPLAHMLVKDVIDVDMQGYRPVVLYINGEYWGIINLREKINEHYVNDNYDIDPDNVDFLTRNPELSYNIISGSSVHYNAMIDYIRNNDITLQSHYDYISTLMDIDEYINYQVIQIFFGARDWPGNNIKFWRSKDETHDRWRWILYDLDHHLKDPFGNIMDEATEIDCECTWPNPPWSTYLFRRLVENETFRNDFISRFSTFTNTHFSRPRIHGMINEMQNAIAPEIPRHILRWGGQRIENPDNTWMSPVFNSVEEWESNIQVMRDFTELRHEIAIQQVNDYFGISGTHRLDIIQATPHFGTVLVDGTPLYDSSFTGEFSAGAHLLLENVADVGFKHSHWEMIRYSSDDSLLIIRGDQWKYDDSGSTPENSWNQPGYNDASWNTGYAEFGYGDGDETTVVSYGPDPSNKYITTRFRKVISIPDPGQFESYQLQILRDDGFVLYINGAEVIRNNMPQWGIYNNTLAEVAVSGEDEILFKVYSLNPSLLSSGENTIAVEIHQAGASSSDISFDMQLTGQRRVVEEVIEIESEKVELELVEEIAFIAYCLPEIDIFSNLFINEIVSGNSTGLTDEAGEPEDWIEIYNGGSSDVDMAGLFLSDTVPASVLWQFPLNMAEVTIVGPNGYIVVFADNDPEQGPLHAGFRLNILGDEVALWQKAGNDTILLDHVTLGRQHRNVAWGRYPDGSDNFVFLPLTTPWSSNIWEPMDTTTMEDTYAGTFRVYPNPARDILYIEPDSRFNESLQVIFYSMTGEIVFQNVYKIPGEQQLSLDGQPSGIYLLELRFEGKRIVRKIVVE